MLSGKSILLPFSSFYKKHTKVGEGYNKMHHIIHIIYRFIQYMCMYIIKMGGGGELIMFIQCLSIKKYFFDLLLILSIIVFHFQILELWYWNIPKFVQFTFFPCFTYTYMYVLVCKFTLKSYCTYAWQIWNGWRMRKTSNLVYFVFTLIPFNKLHLIQTYSDICPPYNNLGFFTH